MNIILRNTKDPIFFEVHPENRKVNVKQNAFEKCHILITLYIELYISIVMDVLGQNVC